MVRLRCGWLALAGGILTLSLGGAPSAAPAPKAYNPQLTAENYRDRQLGDDSDQLTISDMSIGVDILGAIATTTVKVQFANPSKEPVEGNFTLDLPAGSRVTGYALDVDGVMRPGVLVGQRKATLAYEEKVRQGVDPGLAVVTRTNAFNTRIFPIFPGKGRTIELSFVTPISEAKPFVLPLVFARKAGNVQLSVTGEAMDHPPRITGPDGKVVAWAPGGPASAQWKGPAFDGALTIGGVKPANTITFSRHGSGEVFFDMVGQAPSTASQSKTRSVRVYWDRSLSRRDDDLQKERALLRQYLEATSPERIELVTFASDAPTRQTYSTAAQVDAALAGVVYRGGTALTDVFATGESRADVCLLFSDGAMTIDAFDIRRRRCTLIAVSTAPDANTARLSGMAARSGGFSVDLSRTAPEAALNQLQALKGQVAEISTADGRPIDATVLSDDQDGFRIVGRTDPTGDVLVRFRGLTDVLRFRPSSGVIRRHDGAGALWGYGEIADLEISERPDQDQAVALARRYSVASPAAAFIVLESMKDYANAEIEPPTSVGKDNLAEYRELKAEHDKTLAGLKRDRLDRVVQAWNDQKVWWNTTFKPVKPRPEPRKRSESEAAPTAMAPPPPPSPPPPPPPLPPAAPDQGRAGSDSDDNSVGEVMVTGSRRSGGAQDVPIAVTPVTTVQIEAEPWNPDRPYLKALAAAAPDQFETVFRAQEAEYGALPAFYLDVAEYLFRKDRKAEAIQMALSALEMPQANTATMTIVADRMMRYGAVDRALWIHERIVWMEPDRPQPLRALALALASSAEQPGLSPPVRDQRRRRAVDLLNDVISKPWQSKYDGVEVISLMEINRLIPLLSKADGARLPLDPRLVALLDVDIRVVLEWNTDESDMDLWVVEPSGETAIYSNPKTAIGGRLSNDMTNGFGPEEYLLRRAPKGEYQIKVNVYRTDTLDPNGATTVRATLFRNWGRPDQSVEVIEIDLEGKGQGARPVGRFKVGPGRP